MPRPSVWPDVAFPGGGTATAALRSIDAAAKASADPLAATVRDAAAQWRDPKSLGRLGTRGAFARIAAARAAVRLEPPQWALAVAVLPLAKPKVASRSARPARVEKPRAKRKASRARAKPTAKRRGRAR